MDFPIVLPQPPNTVTPKSGLRELWAKLKSSIYHVFILFLFSSLANKIKPGTIKKINKMKMPFHKVRFANEY